ERSHELFSGVLAERTGRDPHDLELRVMTMMTIAAVYTAGVEWLRQGGRGDLLEFYNRAMDIAEAGVRLDAIGPAKGCGHPPAEGRMSRGQWGYPPADVPSGPAVNRRGFLRLLTGAFSGAWRRTPSSLRSSPEVRSTLPKRDRQALPGGSSRAPAGGTS